MANQEHLYFLLNSDAARWNHWKLVNSQIQLDFSNAELREIQLTEKDLSGANFSNADLRGANLSAANLSYANLAGADLSQVWLSIPPNPDRLDNLTGEAYDLKPVDLSNANLTGANLAGANLTGVKLWKTVMPNGEIQSNY